MKGFTNDYADERWGIFLAFALGYIILVEIVSLDRHRSSSVVGGSPDEPAASSSTPRARRPSPGTASTRSSRRVGSSAAIVASSSDRLGRRRPVRVREVGAVPHARLHRGDPRRRPARSPSRWPSRRSSARVVFGLVFGIGKLSDHALVRWPALAGRGVLPRRPGALLMIFCFYAIFGGMDDADRSRTYWCRGRSPSRSTTAPCSPRSSAPASTPSRGARPRRRTPSACARRR